MKYIFILPMFFFSILASASNWIKIAETDDNNTVVYLDSDSVKPFTKDMLLRGNYASGFIQHTYVKNNPFRKRGWYYSKQFYIVNCNESTYYPSSEVVYGFKDQVVDSFDDKYILSSEFKLAFPDTIGETIVNMMCAINNVNKTGNF